jgi:predicted RNA-binding protein with RPS1 domain
MYSSGKLVGTAVSGGATTALNFVDNAGVLAATDTITITHASGKQKEFIEDLMDVVADDNKVAGMVVVRDDMRDLSLPTTRGTVIASVA